MFIPSRCSLIFDDQINTDQNIDVSQYLTSDILPGCVLSLYFEYGMNIMIL